MKVACYVSSIMLAACAGCVGEQSVRLTANDAVKLAGETRSQSTRDWLESAHQQLKPLLPADTIEPMRTSQMVDQRGQPANVWQHFDIDPAGLRTVVGNYSGLMCTAKAASRDFHIDAPPPAWLGFNDVSIPIVPGLSQSARWDAAPPNAGPREATALILLPAMFGDNGVLRTRDLAIALREAGYGVLSLELRGYGQTEKNCPRFTSTFGVLEMRDILAASDWLAHQPRVRRIGLLGFCWGGNSALLAAWFDSRGPHDPNISPAIAKQMPPAAVTPHFTAGIAAVSPILRWEELLDELDKPHTTMGDPIMAGVQDTITQRMKRKGYAKPDGSMRRLIDCEYDHCGYRIPGGAVEGYPFLRLLPYHGQSAHDKLEAARVPVLVMHGANDPLAPAQDIADFIASIHNPRVAGIILPGGGHVGFATFARQYYLSLIVNFFDPVTGPAANTSAPLAKR